MLINDEFRADRLSIEKLRIHFRDVYQLNESQVETMIQSSSKSLAFAMENIDEFLEGKIVYEELEPVFHNLKGVLLNMGEEEWAGFFRVIEHRIAAEEVCDIVRVQQVMRNGLQDILFYERNEKQQQVY